MGYIDRWFFRPRAFQQYLEGINKGKKNSDVQTFEKESMIHIQDVVKGPPIRRFMDKYVFEFVRKNIHRALGRHNGIVSLGLELGKQVFVAREVCVEVRILREGETSRVGEIAENNTRQIETTRSRLAIAYDCGLVRDLRMWNSMTLSLRFSATCWGDSALGDSGWDPRNFANIFPDRV